MEMKAMEINAWKGAETPAYSLQLAFRQLQVQGFASRQGVFGIPVLV